MGYCIKCGSVLDENTGVCPNCGYGADGKGRFCAHCGRILPEGARFCPNCGFSGEGRVCARCGRKLSEEERFCPECGFAVGRRVSGENEGMITVIKVFLILACVVNAFFFLIPLAWCIPMTVVIFRKLDAGEPVGTGMKVCTLLFVSLIAGVLLLCMEDREGDYRRN